MNHSGKESLDFSSDSCTPTTLVLAFYQVQTPESCKRFSSLQHSLKCLHTDKCSNSFISHPCRPQGAALGITCSATPRAMLRAAACNAFSWEQLFSCDLDLQRWIFISPLNPFAFTGGFFVWFISSSNYRINAVKLFLKSPPSKPRIFQLAALNSIREMFSFWKDYTHMRALRVEGSNSQSEKWEPGTLLYFFFPRLSSLEHYPHLLEIFSW